MLAPESVSVPAPILVSPPMPESVPPSVELLPLVSKVPPPKLSVTARFEVKPARYCKVPPPSVRVPEPLPRLLSADTASVPPLIVVPPKYVLAPDSVSVPAPILVRPPMPNIVPENAVLVLSLPVVSVAEPSVTLPAPASEPIIWLKPSRSSVAPLATVNALPAENAFVAPACSVPALTAVAPE